MLTGEKCYHLLIACVRSKLGFQSSHFRCENHDTLLIASSNKEPAKYNPKKTHLARLSKRFEFIHGSHLDCILVLSIIQFCSLLFALFAQPLVLNIALANLRCEFLYCLLVDGLNKHHE
jgi:hypothetical protein